MQISWKTFTTQRPIHVASGLGATKAHLNPVQSQKVLKLILEVLNLFTYLLFIYECICPGLKFLIFLFHKTKIDVNKHIVPGGCVHSKYDKM